MGKARRRQVRRRSWPASLFRSDKEQNGTSEHQQSGKPPVCPPAGWSDLLDEGEEGKGGDPGEVHHAADKQQQHQAPAAAEAEQAMPETEPHRASRAWAPLAHDELQWRLALLKAGGLGARELP